LVSTNLCNCHSDESCMYCHSEGVRLWRTTEESRRGAEKVFYPSSPRPFATLRVTLTFFFQDQTVNKGEKKERGVGVPPGLLSVIMSFRRKLAPYLIRGRESRRAGFTEFRACTLKCVMARRRAKHGMTEGK
jgi:hypothetical protein